MLDVLRRRQRRRGSGNRAARALPQSAATRPTPAPRTPRPRGFAPPKTTFWHGLRIVKYPFDSACYLRPRNHPLLLMKPLTSPLERLFLWPIHCKAVECRVRVRQVESSNNSFVRLRREPRSYSVQRRRPKPGTGMRHLDRSSSGGSRRLCRSSPGGLGWRRSSGRRRS